VLKQFHYLPLAPRLVQMVENSEMNKKMGYRAEFYSPKPASTDGLNVADATPAVAAAGLMTDDEESQADD